MKTRKKKIAYSGNQADIPYMEFIQNNLFNMSHPVESIFETTNSSCNTPENLVNYFKTLFGVSAAGTWERFGEGKVVVGYQSNDNDFMTVGGTGGSKYLQAHTHTMTPSGSISSSFTGTSGTTSEKGSHDHSFTPSGTISSHTHTFQPSGTISGGAHTHGLWSGGGNGANCDGLGWDGSATVATRIPGGHVNWSGIKESECGYKTTFYSSATQQSTMDSQRHIISVATPTYTFTGTNKSTASASPSFTGTSGNTDSKGSHTHTITPRGSVSSTFSGSQGTTSSSGDGSTQNLQPYIVVYRYRRIS